MESTIHSGGRLATVARSDHRRWGGCAAALVTLSLAASCVSIAPVSDLRSLAGPKVDTIAGALRHYQEDNGGGLPETLMRLFPRYLNDESVLWIQEIRSTSPNRATLCYVPRNPIVDPDDPTKIMIAFMSSEMDGGRFVIDNRLNVWFVGEARFQLWLNGTSLFSAGRIRQDHGSPGRPRAAQH